MKGITILVIDGQRGGLGHQIITAIIKELSQSAVKM